MPLYRTLPTAPPWQPQPLRRRQPGLLSNGVYYTTFGATENPISEGGLWILGKTNGVGWSDMRTTPGKAFGTQPGTSGNYDDSIALLRAASAPDQEVHATIFSSVTAIAAYTEVELHLRGTITANSIQTYEIMFSVNPSAQPQGSYCQIAKWLGAQGGTTFNGVFLTGQVLITAPTTGAVVSANIIGNTISAFINGVPIVSVTDSVGLSGTAPYTSGSIGMGHWLHNNGATGDPTTYGFSDFMAMPILSLGDPENYGRPDGLHGQALIQQLLAV